MLENGDLIFVREDTEMGQAIQASTDNYSHVAIFLDGQVYHATVEGGVLYPNHLSQKLNRHFLTYFHCPKSGFHSN